MSPVKLIWAATKRHIFIVQIYPWVQRISITPRYWNPLCHSFISFGRMKRMFCCWSHSHSINCRSIWYPLPLGGLRRCGFKACLRLLHMTSVAGIKPQTPWPRVQRLKTARKSRQTKEKMYIPRCHGACPYISSLTSLISLKQPWSAHSAWINVQ